MSRGWALLIAWTTTRSDFGCPDRECPDYGVKGNVRLKQRYGRNNVAELICRTCGKTFSENRDTPLFRLKLPYEKLHRILTSLVRCGSIRGTADTVGVNKNTVLRIVKLAGKHMKEFNEFMLRNLKMNQAQCDEFWTFVGTKRGSSMTMTTTTTTTRAGRGTSP